MKFNRLILIASVFCGVSAAAQARSNPTPPPSGMVIHLFGPTGVVNDVAPNLLGDAMRPTPAPQSPAAGSPQDAGGQPAGGQPAGGQPAGGQPVGSVSQASDYPEPTMHDVLHQMFVTGDPNDPTRPSLGRSAKGALGN